ncbi:MAG TPA: serine/threonine-protein kinase [Gemmataceae bacterium]|nr:serine/threonine-protein kinase [Gemmataceae bacterium]
MDLSGRTLGEFHILRQIGQGGMGHVYLAEQVSLKRKVAIKVMRPDLAFNDVSFQRFKAEAEAIAKVTHPNIVQVYALGEESGLHYMALEYVEGRNLREYLSKRGTTDTPLALSIVKQVASALQRASEIGIIHRDIKPENILLTKRGEVKVADFGLSRYLRADQSDVNLTQTGMTMGTPLYMSPEQVQGLPLDARTDIYSLGITCYQMLAGAPPFKGKNAFDLATQHVSAAPQPLAEMRPDLLPDVCAMVHKMMAKEPARRYQSCADLLRDVSKLREALAKKTMTSSGAAVAPFATTERGLIAHGPQQATTALSSSTSQFTIILPTVPKPVLLGFGVGLLLLAFLSGGMLAWQQYRPAAESSVPDAHLSATDRQEQILVEGMEQDVDPGMERARINRGVTNRIELGQLYLDQRRLEEADQFFGNLATSKVNQYRVLGRLGHGLVLAYQNHPKESNKVLGESLTELKRIPLLANNPVLKYEIARAIGFNKANATPSDPLPAELERHLLPERPYRVK